MTTSTTLVYAGTYTRTMPHVVGKSEGIYVYQLNMETGQLTLVSNITNVDNPSFLAIHPQNTYLYAANEIDDFGGETSGAVSAFAIDPQTGALTALNQQPTQGTWTCHVLVDHSGQCVLAANYLSGSLTVFPIQADGQLGPASDFVQHEGSSVNPQRQEGPHAHSVTIDAANRFAFAADLGMDKVMIYALDAANGKLTFNSAAKVADGAGPRHFDFHPSGHYAYVINELASTVTAFAYDAEAGTLQELQTVSTLPEGFSGNNSTADIHVAPSGKFLYGSNRGHNSIAIFAIDEASGHLTPIGHESTQGGVPRNFGLDPTGTYLLAANQDSSTVVSFRIDQAAGTLTPTGHIVDVPSPVCLKFLTLGG